MPSGKVKWYQPQRGSGFSASDLELTVDGVCLGSYPAPASGARLSAALRRIADELDA